jgi:hypothetical protein
MPACRSKARALRLAALMIIAQLSTVVPLSDTVNNSLLKLIMLVSALLPSSLQSSRALFEKMNAETMECEMAVIVVLCEQQTISTLPPKYAPMLGLSASGEHLQGDDQIREESGGTRRVRACEGVVARCRDHRVSRRLLDRRFRIAREQQRVRSWIRDRDAQSHEDRSEWVGEEFAEWTRKSRDV